MIESQSEVEANARRAGLCKAACDNISDEHLELIVSSGGFSQLATARLVRDREALLKALKNYMASRSSNSAEKICGHEFDCVCPGDFARETIASIESNSPMPVSGPKGESENG